jgi:hypothetical protein
MGPTQVAEKDCASEDTNEEAGEKQQWGSNSGYKRSIQWPQRSDTHKVEQSLLPEVEAIANNTTKNENQQDLRGIM